MKTYQIVDSIFGYNIKVEVCEGSGNISSNLKKILTKKESDIIESIILGHAVYGIDISSTEYKLGLNSTIQTLGN
jgi:hypothetical protein